MKADSKQVTDALVDMTGSAIERARSESSADLLLADEEFLDLLASKVADKLDARFSGSSGAFGSAVRWGQAVIADAIQRESHPTSGHSDQGPK